MESYKKLELRNQIIAIVPSMFELIEHWKLFLHSFKWRSDGWPAPANSLVKRAVLRREALAATATTFIETGTYAGDTLWFFRTAFSRIYSIEVQQNLAAIAANRFKSFSHVTIIQGDSGSKLPDILEESNSPALVWLDGHYSGGMTGRGQSDCPIWAELNALSNHSHRRMTICIDDARCFGTDPEYPTLANILTFCSTRFPNHRFLVENDIIIIRAPS